MAEELNPVLQYADSYRDMARQGVEKIGIWSVITDLERNIAPLCIAKPKDESSAQLPRLGGEAVAMPATAEPAHIDVLHNVPRELLERALAECDECTRAFEDDANGPGQWRCHACFEYCNASWHQGKIIRGGPDQISHESDCWAEQLRALLNGGCDE